MHRKTPRGNFSATAGGPGRSHNGMNSTIHPSLRATGSAALFLLAAGGVACLTGCGSYPEEHVVSAPPPSVVASPSQQQVVVPAPSSDGAPTVTATPLANGALLITQAPPNTPQAMPAAPASRPPRPTSSHVWVEGYWTWRTDHYQWVPAQWKKPPYADARWVAPRWEQRSDGHYTFYEGYWN